MSRDYDYGCPKCEKSNARKLEIVNNVELLQCLEEDCGACFRIDHKYTELKTKGVDQKNWNKAREEISEYLYDEEPKYTLFWLTGKTQIVLGDEPHTAMNNAGIGQGALRALDFYGKGDLRDQYEWNKVDRSWDKIETDKKDSDKN